MKTSAMCVEESPRLHAVAHLLHDKAGRRLPKVYQAAGQLWQLCHKRWARLCVI